MLPALSGILPDSSSRATRDTLNFVAVSRPENRRQHAGSSEQNARAPQSFACGSTPLRLWPCSDDINGASNHRLFPDDRHE